MSQYKLSDFNFDLPEELIAQTPSKERTQSRLLVYNLETKEITHDTFNNIHSYLPTDSLLVFNNSKVIPARLFGKKAHRDIEFLILKQKSELELTTLTRPGKHCRPNDQIIFHEDITATITSVNEDGSREVTTNKPITVEYLEKYGQLPLPPYIKSKYSESLAERYQTTYAQKYGSIAAPTAGLHFTQELVKKINETVETAEVTLHVGLGTFSPIRSEILTQHELHTEEYELTQETADKLNTALKNKQRIISVGTTSTRTLESQLQSHPQFTAGTFHTNIFIKPGYKFKTISGLVTNFHLPQSSLFILISTFLGLEEAQRIYKEAIKEKYRFYSFGDACLFI